MYDAIIIGAGPAGLQAAMALSRVRRPHLVISIPKLHRNVAAAEMHTFLTRDGTPPLEFIRVAREQLDSYGFAKHVDGKVVSVEKVGAGFEVKLEDGSEYGGRKLIIATGVKDVFLPIEGFSELWGSDIVHCVFCHGYEHRDQLCGAIGIDNPMAFQSAMSGLTLASSMQLFPNIESPDLVPVEMKDKLSLLQAGGCVIMPFKKIVKFSKHHSGSGVDIYLSDGSVHHVDWILYKPKTTLSSPELASQLGIELNPMGDIKVGPFQETNVSGVFAAGDCVNFLKQGPVAISEGFTAGAGIHLQLTLQDMQIAKAAAK